MSACHCHRFTEGDMHTQSIIASLPNCFGFFSQGFDSTTCKSCFIIVARWRSFSSSMKEEKTRQIYVLRDAQPNYNIATYVISFLHTEQHLSAQLYKLS